MNHELKIDTKHFIAILEGRKTFEIRRDDRDFRVGDTLELREFLANPGSYTGEYITVEVVHMSHYAMAGTGHVVLGIGRCEDD